MLILSIEGEKILIFSPLFGILFSLTGLLLSFFPDLPAGSSIAIVYPLGFGISVLLSPKKEKINPQYH
jgi:ABC-type Mn2+/Zn2+ transport system permease subunit